jgi:hypothetical protein
MLGPRSRMIELRASRCWRFECTPVAQPFLERRLFYGAECTFDVVNWIR